MIFPDKKKTASLILSRMDDKGRTREVSASHEGGEHNEYTAHAESLLHALENKSVAGIAAALRSFHSMVKDEDIKQDQGE